MNKIKRFILKEHNSKEQIKWGANDDTREFLEVGKTYEGYTEEHSWHTKIIINGKKFNSVCFTTCLRREL